MVPRPTAYFSADVALLVGRGRTPIRGAASGLAASGIGAAAATSSPSVFTVAVVLFVGIFRDIGGGSLFLADRRTYYGA